jgi:hypothetical protein
MKNTPDPVHPKKSSRRSGASPAKKTVQKSHRQEATIITGQPEELKDFLVRHLAMPIDTGKRKRSAADKTENGDLFRQAKPSAEGKIPDGVKMYDTVVMRKKKGK